MKLLIAIIHKDDSSKLRSELIKNNFASTKLSTSGNFLSAENTTFLVGVEKERLDNLISIIKETCGTREEIVVSPVTEFFTAGPHISLPLEVKVGGATIFVLDVEQFLKI